MSEIEVDLAEGTYEIVTSNYSKLIVNQDDDNEEGTIEYLDTEVVEEIEDDYYSTVDESQDNITFDDNNKKIYTTQQVYLTTTTNDESFVTADGSIKLSSGKKRKRSEIEQEPVRKNNQFLRVREMGVDNGSSKNILPVKIVGEDGPVKSSNPFILQVESGLSKGKPTSNGKSRPASDNDNNNIDIFFKSMANTVVNLPLHVQAKIKMDVCKVIAMAEIKYCTDQTQSWVNN